MCQPRYFGVEYMINPWMEGNLGRARAQRAMAQWEQLYRELSARAEVDVFDPVPGLPDMAFAANAGLVFEENFIASQFRVAQRRPEIPYFVQWGRRRGLRVFQLEGSAPFEGEGDALFQPGQRLLWAGYGIRSSLESHRSLSELTQAEVVSLRLIDPRFYHLDTCFCPMPEGRGFYYPEAFDLPSLKAIRSRIAPEQRIEIDEDDAMHFACNAVVLGDTLILNYASQRLRSQLEQWGFEVVLCPLDEFLLAGGAAKCLVLRLDHDLPSRPRHAPPPRSAISDRVMELTGHLLDSGVMGQLLDVAGELGVSVQIIEFHPAARREQLSSLRFRLTATSPQRLEKAVSQLAQLGAQPAQEERDARLLPVTQPSTAPAEFYVTTPHPTDVRLQGQWIRAQHQRAGSVLAVDSPLPDTPSLLPTVRCLPLRELQAGQQVVCGVEGVRIHTPSRFPGDLGNAPFGSGYPGTSYVEAAIEQIAWEMHRVRERGGKTLVVAGPALIAAGGCQRLASLLRQGYVHGLLAGNAFGVLDIELALGQSVEATAQPPAQEPVAGVQETSAGALRAINCIRECGGIAQAVSRQMLQGGVLFECVSAAIPYVLVSSIRDEEPLPETCTNVLEAQQRYGQLLEDADIVLVLASRLHGLAIRSLAPSTVHIYCVDINPAMALRIAEHTSSDSLGVVLDVGLFLNLLASRLANNANFMVHRT